MELSNLLPSEPVAHFIQLRWIIMSPRNEINLANLLLLRVSIGNYEQICNLNALGVNNVQ